jgi:adenylate kinase
MITFKQFLDESINDRGILKAMFVVGIPGAGKSYTVSQLKGTISPRVVNTDRATEYLSKKLGIESNDQTWKTVFRDRTRPITTNALAGYLNGMLPLFVDGTSNDVSNILGRAGILESLGYDVGMVFVDADLDIAKERAKKRGEDIGRHVNTDFIEKVHALAADNKEYFRGKFGFFKEIKNNPGELDDAAMKKIFNEVSGFFEAPVENPVGKRTLEKLQTEKQKYLVPTIMDEETLKKKVAGWYRT